MGDTSGWRNTDRSLERLRQAGSRVDYNRAHGLKIAGMARAAGDFVGSASAGRRTIVAPPGRPVWMARCSSKGISRKYSSRIVSILVLIATYSSPTPSRIAPPVPRVGGHLEARLNGVPLRQPERARCANLVVAYRASAFPLESLRSAPFYSLICPLPEGWLRFTGALEVMAIVQARGSSEPPGPLQRHTEALQLRPDHRLKIELIPVRDSCSGVCTAADGPSRGEMVKAMAMLKYMYPASSIDVIFPDGWLRFPDDRFITTLLVNLHQSHMLWGSKGKPLPQAGRDTIRLGVVREEPQFLDFDGSLLPRNGTCDAELRVGMVRLGPNDPTVTAAHEVGHCLGLDHVPDGRACPLDSGSADGCEDYPYDGTWLSDGGARDHYGWRNGSGVRSPTDHGDIMTYQDNRWISDYTYLKMYCLIEHLALPEAQLLNRRGPDSCVSGRETAKAETLGDA